MVRIYARKVLAAKPIALWDHLTEQYEVIFDDAVLVMRGTDIILSRYAWTLHETDAAIPLLSSMTVIPHLKHDLFATGTMRSLFNEVLWYVFDHYHKQVDVYDLVERIQHANLALYNDASIKTARFISSLHITDYLALLDHPKLLALKEEAAKDGFTMTGVETAIRKATKLMTSKELVDANGKLLAIPKSCIAGIIKAPQAVQAVFMRGTVPDLKMESIPYPLINSLTEGMNTPLEYAILSREGSIAEMASMDDLQTVCYNGRKFALVAQAKQSIIKGDCGSTNYLYWEISKDEIVNGKVVSESDLSLVEGMWYLDTDNVLKQLSLQDTHLKGTTIRRRSPLTCKLGDGHHVCSTCFGELAESIPTGSNVGVDLSKQFTQVKAQNTMSIKHILSTLVGETAKLDATSRKYLKVEDNVYYLHPSVYTSAQRILLELDRRGVRNLAQVESVGDVHNLTPSHVASFTSCTLHITTNGKSNSVDLELSQSNVACMLSYDVLNMIKRDKIANIVSVNDTSCIIDITGIREQSLFIKPDALPPISEMSSNLSKIFERSGSERKITSETDIMGTLERLHKLLHMMGPTHLSVVEILLASYLTKGESFNVQNGTDGLSDLHQATGEQLLLNRSLSTWLIYNSPVTAFLNNPSTFNRSNRDDSMLDIFVSTEGIVD